MERLDASAIHIPGVHVRVLERCGSTNTCLLEETRVSMPALFAAEVQTAGRGRRGRRWLSEPGDAITFSLALRTRQPLRALAATSLAAGVACVRALRALGAAAVALKWPNDLVAGDAKLGGILVETRADEGGVRVVIGVGINYRGGAALGRRLRRKVASLDELGVLPGRARVIEAIGGALVATMQAFEARGVEAVRREWEALDAHAGRRLRVRLPDGRTVSGVAAGLAADGGLRLLTRAGVRAITSGTVIASSAA